MTYHLILGYEIIRLKDKTKRKIESSKEWIVMEYDTKKKMLNVENSPSVYLYLLCTTNTIRIYACWQLKCANPSAGYREVIILGSLSVEPMGFEKFMTDDLVEWCK
jgi:hypothetical protein